MLRRGIAWLLLASLTSCAARLPVAPAQPADDPTFVAEVAEAPPGLPDDAPAAFTLRAGDVVAVKIVSLEVTDLGALAVDGQGRIFVPMVGAVELGGCELPEASRRLETAVRTLDRTARVALWVLDPAGHTVTVIGAVERPGVLPLHGALRLVEAIAATGGTRSAASDGEIASLADLDAGRVVRDGTALPISLGRALRGEPGHDVWLRAGDVVVVPAASGERIRVLGQVRSPRVVPFHPGMRLTEAIALAGGTTEDADEADVRVLRGPLSAPHVYCADLKALFRGGAKDVELAKGDVVFVTEHWLASMGHVLQRLTPLLAATAVGLALKK